MFAIIGIVLVFGAVIGGYLMEHGNLKVLMQPAELLIIGGAGLGTLLTGNPPAVLKALLGGLGAVFGNSKYDQGFYQGRFQADVRRDAEGAQERPDRVGERRGKAQ